jgi:folylpolyglutamate synthase/dihydropteroate synthase
VVLDVGHNPEALGATLDVAEKVLGGVRPTVVLGMLRDKKLGRAALRLARSARAIVLTAPRVERAWDPARARARFPTGRGLARIVVEPAVAAALGRALDAASGPLLVIGSHYLLGEVVPLLAARCGIPPEDLLAGHEEEPLGAAVR